MSRQVPMGSVVKDSFPVFDWDGVTRITGLTGFTINVWKDNVADGVTVNISELTPLGQYGLEFTPSGVGFWKVQVEVPTYTDVWEFDYDVSIGSIGEMYEIIRRIAGLSQENIFIDNTEFGPDGQLIASRVRIFDTKANCDAATDGGSETTGLLATYDQDTVWEGINQFATYRQTKVT